MTRLRHAICIIALLITSSIIQTAAAASLDAGAFFDLSVLNDWRPDLSPSAVHPFTAEGMRSELLWSARSNAGSHIFITLTDNTLKRPVLSAARLNAITTEQSLARFQPVFFDKGVREHRAYNDAGGYAPMDIFVVHTRGRGFPSFSGGTVSARTVYFPIVLRRGDAYYNYLLMADYRGLAENVGDAERFERFYGSFSTARSGYTLVDPEAFEMVRAQRAAVDALARNADQPTPQADPPAATQTPTPNPIPAALSSQTPYPGPSEALTAPIIDIYE